jgi:hypothetical protein
MGEAQYAEEVLNRALYALEMAWHPAFDPSRGRCRLDIEEPENRPLFVALFRHAQVRVLLLLLLCSDYVVDGWARL